MTDIIKRLSFCLVALIASLACYALPMEHYAQSSRLSQGRWVKITVSQTGMQFISNAQLKEWGFSDPAKVNVFGYGGQRIKEALTASQPDDLPCQPVVRTDAGLCFYGVNTISWKSALSTIKWDRQQNNYGTESCYFLSDIDIEPEEMPSIKSIIDPQATEVSTFTEHLLHEKELAAGSNTGADLLGEDFRGNLTQTFSFNLADKASDQMIARVIFAAKTAGNGSTLKIKANGKEIGSASIAAATSNDTHYIISTNTKTFTDAASRLDLELGYKSSGVITLARLDHIIISYERHLSLNSQQLCFDYDTNDTIAFALKGCTSATQIWDVTDTHRPIKIEAQLQGNTARFAPIKKGLRSYVAFNPGKMPNTPAFSANVANQDLHSMPVPDMVIISPAEFVSQAQRIAALHEEMDSMLVYIITPEEIYNEFSSGTQDLTAFRKMLKMWYDRSPQEGHSLGYCLLFGRPSYDNRGLTEKVRSAGYPRIPIWQSPESSSETSYSTDDYIVMLEDASSPTFNISSQPLSIAVGRMPVRSVSEASKVVDKLIRYVKEPELGSWRNNVMLIADDEDSGDHLKQSEDVYKQLRGSGNGKDFIYEKIYLDSYPLGTSSSGKSYPLARERMLKMFDEGVLYLDYIGHGNPVGWTHERLLTYTDIINMSNTRLPFMLTATCEFTRWDDDEISGAELMFLNPTAGAIGFISATRQVYIPNNGRLNRYISRVVFQRDADGLGKRVGDIHKDGKNLYLENGGDETNKLRFMVMGDPAMRLPSPAYNVVIDEIDGIKPQAVSDPDDYPVIPARGKVLVKGHIADNSGQLLTDFNGVAVPTLFDAERAIETFGHGEKGQVMHYNDRKNKLFTSKVPVVNGQWEVTILMPSEIDNNYSPALLNIYAYSDDMREANGSTESLYVYGWNDKAEEDLTGPEISLLALNSQDFEDGDNVNDSPMLLAKFRDDSGINISTSGFGHAITAVLDDHTVIDNLVDFYQADLEDFTAGSITYPLADLAAGTHTLKFTVWDNANNSSSQTITFNVSDSYRPSITDLRTNVNPASTDVTFYVNHDTPSASTVVRIEVFDLSGKKVWTSDDYNSGNNAQGTAIQWNLHDTSGSRVQRGIYLYRAVVTTSKGEETTLTRKLAVTAQ